MATRRKFLGGAAVAAVSGAAGAAPAPHPDADLLAMIAEAERIDAAGDALSEAVADIVPSDGPEWAAFERRVEAEMPRWHALVERIARHPARTREGLRAKGKLARSTIALDIAGLPCGDDLLAWSVLNELLGEA